MTDGSLMQKKHFDEMLSLMEGMPLQLLNAMNATEKVSLSKKLKAGNINNILIQGMGASGVVGYVLQSMLKSKLKIPVKVSHSDGIQGFVDKKTLFIAISYSGNTTETLNALKQAKNKNAMIVCITSGGKMAKMHKGDIVYLEQGFPPRTQIMQMLAAGITVLKKSGVVNVKKELNDAALFMKKNIGKLKGKGKSYSKKLRDKFIIIYSGESITAVAKRFKQQLNENTKMFTHNAYFPEVNHNEIEALRFPAEKKNIAFLFIRHSHEHKETAKRMAVAKRILKNKGSVIEIKVNRKSFVQEVIELITILDFISYWLAVYYNEDPINLRFIPKIKEWLSK